MLLHYAGREGLKIGVWVFVRITFSWKPSGNALKISHVTRLKHSEYSTKPRRKFGTLVKSTNFAFFVKVCRYGEVGNVCGLVYESLPVDAIFRDYKQPV